MKAGKPSIICVGAGISGLTTAFYLQKYARERDLPVDLSLYEADNRSGGKAFSQHEKGFVMEWGPNGFLDNKPSTVQLCRDLDIDGQLLVSNASARIRFIAAHGLLNQLPTGPVQFFGSTLLSPRGKLRLLAEPFIKKGASGIDETVAAFARRRLGPEALDYLIDPMVSGVFAGNPEQLSLQSSFPRIHELEQLYGGLIRALLTLSFQRLKQKRPTVEQPRKPRSGPAGPGGVLTSFPAGIQYLTDRLVQSLGQQPCLDHKLVKVEPANSDNRNGFRLTFQHNSEYTSVTADVVVLAIPAYEMAPLFAKLAPLNAAQLSNIPYAPVAVVGLGFEKQQLEFMPEGFGFVVPHREHKNILGTLFSTCIFRQRAPENHVLPRTMVGGSRKPELVSLSEHDLVELTLREIGPVLGIRSRPVYSRVARHERAIPQYTVGHKDRLAAMEQLSCEYKGLFITGNAFRGIGINDCTREGQNTARNVMAYLHSMNWDPD